MKSLNLYGYETSPIGLYTLTRDGAMILPRSSEEECWRYIYRHHCYSVEHAIKYEGYKIHPLQEPKAVQE